MVVFERDVTTWAIRNRSKRAVANKKIDVRMVGTIGVLGGNSSMFGIMVVFVVIVWKKLFYKKYF
jgi:hypothetical protein